MFYKVFWILTFYFFLSDKIQYQTMLLFQSLQIISHNYESIERFLNYNLIYIHNLPPISFYLPWVNLLFLLGLRLSRLGFDKVIRVGLFLPTLGLNWIKNYLQFRLNFAKLSFWRLGIFYLCSLSSDWSFEVLWCLRSFFGPLGKIRNRAYQGLWDCWIKSF